MQGYILSAILVVLTTILVFKLVNTPHKDRVDEE